MVNDIGNQIDYKKRLVRGLLRDMEKLKTKITNLRKGIEDLIKMRRIYRR